jgi:hypothetical protein
LSNRPCATTRILQECSVWLAFTALILCGWLTGFSSDQLAFGALGDWD